MSLIIKNGLVFTQNKLIESDVLIVDGKIAEISNDIRDNSSFEQIDARGKLVLPGVIDAHVHYFMKTATGRTIDDFQSGSISAAFGGITSFIDFASPVFGKTMLESLKEREDEAKEKSFLDYSLHMEVTGEFFQNLDQLTLLKKYGVNSLKIYTTYGDTRLPDQELATLFEKTAENDLLMMIHAEDDEIITQKREEFIKEGKTLPCYHALSRPPEAEEIAIKKVIQLAKEKGTKLYIAHVSTSEGVALIRKAQADGQQVLGETCPHYLLLTDECYRKDQPQKCIMAPPLRAQKDCDALWEALADNVLQCVVTDHCAFSFDEKLSSNNCFEAIPGIGGSETLLSLLYSEGVLKNRITLPRLMQIISENPAKIFGLYPKKGEITVGADADIVIFDPEKEVILHGADLHSEAGYTVFEGLKVKGYPVVTMLRGNIICMDNKLVAEKATGAVIYNTTN